MIVAADPSGPWHAHPQRSEILDALAKIVWSILHNLQDELSSDHVLLKQGVRVLNNPCWTASEVKTAWKYRLRYISGGVYAHCATYGHLDKWATESKTKRGSRPEVNHEHVPTRKQMIETLLKAKSLQEIRERLETAEACVVTPNEHKLIRKEGGGWEGYRRSGIGVWDRRDQCWKLPQTQCAG